MENFIHLFTSTGMTILVV